MQGLKEIKHELSVDVALNIANTEACLSGSQYIEPFHILLAILNVVDDRYEQTAESIGMTPQQIKSVGEMAAKCRAELKISDADVTAVRRHLQKILRERNPPSPIHKLEFSKETTWLFHKAARRTYRDGTEEIDLKLLLEELLSDLPPEIAPLFGR
jgi:ATP-dependent Clp protease ATP-binding subunit ClpA